MHQIELGAEPPAMAALEISRKPSVRRDGISNGSGGRGLPSARHVRTTGTWIVADGSPYRIPVMPDERRRRLARMKADNEARLKELMKPPRRVRRKTARPR